MLRTRNGNVPPTSDGTRPLNEGEESEKGMESDAGAKADADSQQMSRSCGLYHGARTTVTRFWEKGSPEDCIVQDADKAIARPLQEFERLQFKIDPLDKGLYYVTRYGELIDKVTKEKAEEAQKARIQVQKEAEGCLKQMLADTDWAVDIGSVLSDRSHGGALSANRPHGQPQRKHILMRCSVSL